MLFECSHNSDQTEGRGSMVPFAWEATLEDAVKRVQGEGVMGCGPGDVHLVQWVGEDVEMVRKNGGPVKKTRVYGAHWIPGRGSIAEYAPGWDPRGEDPEWQRLLKLAEKFEVDVVAKR